MSEMPDDVFDAMLNEDPEIHPDLLPGGQVTVRLHQEHAEALLSLVEARPYDEEWSSVVYDSIRDALASQPLVEQQITEEMVERAAEAAWQAWPSDPEPSWKSLQEAIRAALEAALGAPSQETGEGR